MQNIEAIGLDLDSLALARVERCGIEDVRAHCSSNKYTLNVISQNIRSIKCNMNEFSTLLQRSNIGQILDWDLLVINECWLLSNSTVPYLENYSHASTSKHRTQNEGVVIYYRSHLKVTFEEPQVDDANCLIAKISNDICLIGLYRPPSFTNTANFVNSLDTLLAKLNNFKNIIICGDMNIDIAPGGSDRRANDYLTLLASHKILPGHNLTTHGRTCLDHLMLRTKLEALCFVMDSSITDHDCVALSLKLKYDVKPESNQQTKLIDFIKLDGMMSTLDFSPIYICIDPDLAANLLVTPISSAIKQCTTTTNISKRKIITKPWITPGLLRCLRNRDNLHKKTKKFPNNDVIMTTYKRYRNFCTQILKKAKLTYDKEKLESAGNNKKKLWEVIKGITSINRVVDHSVNLLAKNPQRSVNNVNTYFKEIGLKLAQKINSSSSSSLVPCSNVQTSPSNSLVIMPVDEDEVARLLSRQ